MIKEDRDFFVLCLLSHVFVLSRIHVISCGDELGGNLRWVLSLVRDPVGVELEISCSSEERNTTYPDSGKNRVHEI